MAAYGTYAQHNVGIGTTTPHPSAKLEVQSTTQGLLIPRLSTTERNAIASPAAGLQIYNTTDQSLDFYNGTHWLRTFGMEEQGVSTIADSWSNLPSMITRRQEGAIFAIGNRIYVGAGDTVGNSQISAAFQEYNVHTNTWRRLINSNLPDGARWFPFSFAIGGKGYVGGGIVSSNNINQFSGTLWEFDPDTELWTACPSAPEDLVGAVAVVAGNMVYVGTGRPSSGNVFKRSWYQYNPASRQWTAKATLPGPGRWHAQAFYAQGKVVLVGGELAGGTRTNDVWTYDPATDAWEEKNTFPGNARSGGVTFSIGERGFIGYGTGPGGVNDFFEYNATHDTWTPRALAPLSGGSSIAFRHATATNGVGYVFGGGITQVASFRYLPSAVAPVFVPGSPTASAYLNNGIWGKVGETIYNLNSGRVGIGTTEPQTLLDVAGLLQAQSIRLQQGAAAGRMLVAADADGTMAWQNQPWQVNDNNAIKPFGFVGIGIGTPTAPLHISASNLIPLHVNGSASGGTMLRLSNSSLGTPTWDILMAGSAPGNLAAGSLNLRHSSSQEVALGITSSRLVGIRTAQPLAPLHVVGTSASNSGTSMRYFNHSIGSITTVPAWAGTATILAEGNICATEAFISAQSFSFSDARIKQVVSRTNGQQDLELLRRIAITRYRYLDTLAMGSGIHTKVIAQELKEVLPQAVNMHSQYLPSILQLATALHYQASTGQLRLTLPQVPGTRLPTGSAIKCIAPGGAELHYTLITAQGKDWVLQGPPAAAGSLFVYGHLVPDFHVVDYQAISMLNVSATQALLQRIEALEALVQKLQAAR